MAQTIKMVFQFRRDTAANWEANKTVVPAAGEPCFVIDKNILKIGDGIKTFEELEPINGVNIEVAGDGKSVVMKDDVFSLIGFDAATVGAQPRKSANGELEWIVPSTDTIDGLQSSVAGLQSDVKTLQDIVGVSEGKDSLVNRVTTVESVIGVLNGDVTVDGSVKKTVSDEINAWANKITDNGTVDTIKEFVDYVADHNGEVDKMVGDITTLQGLVGAKSVEDQISDALTAGNYASTEKVDSLQSIVDGIAISYLSQTKAKEVYKQVKYEITSKPVGTLVDYREKEIRVMCPVDTVWTKQNVGSTGNANMYYMGFKAYAPDGAVGFKEGDQGVIEDEYFDFTGDFAGIDAYGRKYSIVWLPLASYEDGSWTYFGKSSTTKKYIGWTYCVEWYGVDGAVISSDSIRINLANESCYSEIKPFYMAEVENKIESVTIGGTVLDIVDKQVVIPVGAGLKSSNEIKVAEDGTLSIGTISFDKVVNGESEIVMDGGSAV